MNESKEELLDQIAGLRRQLAAFQPTDMALESANQARLQRAADMEVLHAAAIDINSQPNLAALLDTIIRRAVQLAGTQMGGLFMSRDGGKTLSLEADYPHQPEHQGKSVRVGEGIAGQIALTGQAMTVGNYRAWKRQARLSDLPIGRILGIPLTQDNTITGVITVFDLQPGTFDENIVRLLTVFAAQAAITLRNAKILEAEREQRQMAEALREAAMALSASLDFDQILDRLLELIVRVVPYDAGSVMLIDGEACRVVRSHAAPHMNPDLSSQIDSLVFAVTDTANLQWMVDTRQPLIIADVRTFPGWLSAPNLDYLRSWAGAPIIANQQVIGFFTLDKTEVNFYRPHHADQLAAFAGQTAIALENARLFKQTKMALAQTKALYQASRSVIAFDDLLPALQSIADGVAEALPANWVSLITVDQAAETVTHFVGGGPGKASIEQVSYQELWQGLTGWVLQHRQPALSLKGKPDPRESLAVQQRRANTNCGAIIVTPLVYRHTILGTMTAANDSDEPDFTQSDVDLMMTLTSQAAVAVQNSRLFFETRHQAQQLATLNKLARQMSGVLNVPELCQMVANHLQLDFGFSDVSVFFANTADRILELQAATGTYAGVLTPGQYRQTFDQGVIGKTARQMQTMVVPDTRLDPDFIAPNNPAALSEVALPLVAGGHLVGVINVEDSRPNAFSDTDVATLTTIADQLAVAMEKARLFDQSRQRAAQLEILHQETRKYAHQLQQILDTVQEGILLVDSHHCILLVNPTAQSYLKALADVVNPGTKLTHFGTLPLAKLLGPFSKGGWHDAIAAGPPRKIFEVAARTVAPEGEHEGWVIVLRDVSDERKSQEHARQQERLAAVGQLAAGIAHDFNNILTSIIGYAELVRSSVDISELTQQDLHRIIEQSQRAAQLVRQILDFSRQSITQKRPIDLLPFLKETVKLLKRTIPENIRITLDFPPDRHLYTINGDPVQLQQTLTNLAVNARDAMPGGGELSISLRQFEINQETAPPHPDLQAGNWVELAVADTGYGISPEDEPHLFEPFFTTKEVGRGTGLGLAQVYGIVSQHNGLIQVFSQVNQGATFNIYFPAVVETNQQPPQPAFISAARGRGETILLVEDNKTVLKVTRSLLEHLGYKVLTARNGQEAIDTHHKHHAGIDLVLSDITMPVMDGVTLAKELHKIDAAVKIVALTGYPLEKEAKTLLDQGFMDWIQKPLEMEDLAQVVARSLLNTP
jgi:signal transduction histidine kinase